MKSLLSHFLVLFALPVVLIIYPVEATLINASDTLTNSKLSKDVSSPQSSIHTVVFTTSISVVTPTIEVRIPAKSQSSLSNDNIPDSGDSAVAGQSGFDLGHLTYADVTCEGGGITWQSPIVVASDMTGDYYHLIKCVAVAGQTLAAGQTIIITIGNMNKLINPVGTVNHVTGQADIYKIAINELDSNGKLADRTIVNTAPVNGVTVSAVVPEALTFTITGVESGSYCGKDLTSKTTDTAVPFGKILAGVYNAANLLTVNTNGASGYTVSVNEDRPLSIDSSYNVTIPDTSCPDNKCTNSESIITPADWTKTTDSGFGFSLSGIDAVFQYGDHSRKFNAAPFSKTLAEIMRHDGPIGESSAYICYQLSVSPFQQSGIYSNKLTFVAVPKF